MIARIRTRLTNRAGQALVEFALVLPLVLLLILGAVDFGLAYNYKNDETHLANEAARFAVVNSCSPCGGQPIETFVQSDADSADLRNGGGQILPPGVQISFCFEQPVSSPAPGQIGDALRATATATYRFLPYVVSLVGLPTTVTIVGTATQRIEQPYDSAVPANNAYGRSVVPPACLP